MDFELLINHLNDSNTFEEFCEKHGYDCVECIKNQVYEDEDLYEFLESLGAKIESYYDGYVVIITDDKKSYQIPSEDHPNRHGDDLPNETLLFFEPNRIKIRTEKEDCDLEEICPHCSHVNQIKWDRTSRKTICQNCGEEILLCSLCNMDEVECSKCPY